MAFKLRQHSFPLVMSDNGSHSTQNFSAVTAVPSWKWIVCNHSAPMVCGPLVNRYQQEYIRMESVSKHLPSSPFRILLRGLCFKSYGQPCSIRVHQLIYHDAAGWEWHPWLCLVRCILGQTAYRMGQWNWLSDVTGCTWATCIHWRQRVSFMAPGCMPNSGLWSVSIFNSGASGSLSETWNVSQNITGTF